MSMKSHSSNEPNDSTHRSRHAHQRSSAREQQSTSEGRWPAEEAKAVLGAEMPSLKATRLAYWSQEGEATL